MGRSTAYGALAINTHAFKDVAFVKKYTGPGVYTGGAVTVGAGVQGRDLFFAGFNQSPKVNIVGGECAVCVAESSVCVLLTFCARLLDLQDAISKEVVMIR